MVEVSFAAAFAGGVLSLLPPCSALLLPAFFANAFTSRTELFGRTLLSLAGLCTVFVPLSLGASLVAALTVAASTASALLGASLLFTCSLGTAAPLFVIAWLWDRYQLGRWAWLRGRPLRIGPLTVFSTNLIAGLLFILLGISFIAFQGTSALSVYDDDLGLGDLGFRTQLWVADTLAVVPDGVWLALAGLVVSAVWLRRRLRPQPASTSPRHGSAQAAS